MAVRIISIIIVIMRFFSKKNLQRGFFCPPQFFGSFIDYSKYKYELFLLDFCYFINLSVALQTLGWPDNLTWFHANYSLCMGPICMSIVVWQNSLVFHSLDKVTSYFLHVFPTIMCHSIRLGL